MKAVILHHKSDQDGKLSGAVCAHWLNKIYSETEPLELQTFGLDHYDKLPEIVWEEQDRIYIVDLNWPSLMDRPELQEKIYWIDHHRTAIEKYGARGFAGFQLDGVAACRLAWQHFLMETGKLPGLPGLEAFRNREVTEPGVLTLAGEHDVWDHSHENSELCNYGLNAMPELHWDRFVTLQFKGHMFMAGKAMYDVIDAGSVIKAYRYNDDVFLAESFGHTITWFGLKFLVLCGVRGSAAFVTHVQPEHDGCMAWRHGPKGCEVSLYGLVGMSRKQSPDLSKLAQHLGGGGHAQACGFRVSLERMLDILGGREATLVLP